MLTVPAKSILQKFNAKYDWFGLDYNMNLYRGCCHGCIYCDSRSDCYGIENFDTVRVKEGCIELLAKELSAKRSKGVVGIGSMSDPYNPFERQYEYTRKALSWLDHFSFGISVVTKSADIVRDLDLYSAINKHSPVITKLTITTADDALAAMIEPHVSAPSERFAAIAALAEKGIFCGVMLMPILPFITDSEDNIAAVVAKAAESGANFIYPAFGVTLRANQRDYFYQKLDECFPGVRRRYVESFGSSYFCGSKYYKRLKHVFEAECARHNLLYKMADIISAYKVEKDYFPY